MLIAKLDNGDITVGDYRELFPNTSFPPSGPSAEWMQENNCLGVTVFKSHNRETQKLVPVAPYIEDNEVFTVAVESKSAEEIAAGAASLAAQVRSQRNRLLADCDWTQLADSIADKQAWGTYRQALRDISSQAGFPSTVVWPHDPNWVEPQLPQA